MQLCLLVRRSSAFHTGRCEDNQDRGGEGRLLGGEGAERKRLAKRQVSPVLTLNLALLPLPILWADLRSTPALVMLAYLHIALVTPPLLNVLPLHTLALT